MLFICDTKKPVLAPIMTVRINPEDGLKSYETWKIWKNVIVISVAFMILYVAANGTINLQSSINAEAGLGTASLATAYAAVILSNIFLSVIIIKWLGTKWAVCLSIILHMPSIACQMYPSFYTLIPSTIVSGLSGGPLWCAKCTYLAMVAEAYSDLFKVPYGVLLNRFLGFFYTIFQMNQIFGNLISSLVLYSGNNRAAETSLNATMIPQLCGANFLAQSDAKDALPKQPLEKIQTIAGIYLACMAAAVVIVAVGLDSMQRYESKRKSRTSSEHSGLQLLVMTVKQLARPDQLLLIVITIFIGLHQAFFFADFNASFVSCSIGTGSVGYIMMTFGMCNAVGSFITSCVVKWVGRIPLFLGALFIHGGVFVMLLAWRPLAGDYYIMTIIAVLWGICDAVWTVQINAYYGILFQGQEEAAFSNFYLWTGSGHIISYILSSYIKTRFKVYLLICSMIVGVSGYLAVEYRQRRKNKKVDETK